MHEKSIVFLIRVPLNKLRNMNITINSIPKITKELKVKELFIVRNHMSDSFYLRVHFNKIIETGLAYVSSISVHVLDPKGPFNTDPLIFDYEDLIGVDIGTTLTLMGKL
jgi:hypothetical protein